MKRNTNSDLIKIGIRLKAFRQRRGLTLEETASRARLSKGLLSKIENFRAIPSVPVLCSLAGALNVDAGELIQGIGEDSEDISYVLTRPSERMRVEREDAIGFVYESMGSRNSGTDVVEAFLLTISPGSKRKRVTTNGEQFIYILKGEIEFHYGRERLLMGEGDTLLFDGRIPHVPKLRKQQPAILLALYLLKNESE